LVEQRIENPRVVGSIPTQATKYKVPQFLQRFWGIFISRVSLLRQHQTPSHALAAADAETAAADAAFREDFEAAGYERTEDVRMAQRRKADAQELADATRTALGRCGPDQQQQLIEASRLAREYIGAHQDAYAAYAQAQAREAIAQAGEQIARAMASMAHVPSSKRLHEEFYGRDVRGLPSPHNDAGQLAASRAAVILDELAELAKARPEYARRPHVEMLGVCDLGALSAHDLLTPAQVHVIRQRLATPH
jgi:hypothetical protein